MIFKTRIICGSEAPCKVKRGEASIVTFYFTPTTQIPSIHLRVSTVIWFRIDLPGLEKDGCKSSAGICPLKAEKQVKFTLPLKIPGVAPR
ncbi:hypothetical protein MXB_2876, partial [Myxobolus squamalis]